MTSKEFSSTGHVGTLSAYCADFRHKLLHPNTFKYNRQMDAFSFIFQIAILIFSVVIHEVSHGMAALYLGDHTAQYEGRLTLNPLKHLSFMGMVIVPIFTLLIWGIPVGSAKPVPYNPYNLRNQKWGPAMVAAAGPISNLFVALFFGMVIRALIIFNAPLVLLNLIPIFTIIVALNILLAVINLVPIPPIDGSKVVFPFFARLSSSEADILVVSSEALIYAILDAAFNFVHFFGPSYIAAFIFYC